MSAPAEATANLPVELSHIDPMLVEMPTEELAETGYSYELLIAQKTAELMEALKGPRSFVAQARAVLTHRVKASGGTLLPHPSLDIKIDYGNPTRERDIPAIEAVVAEYPAIDWKPIISKEPPKPVEPETKVDLRKLDTLCRKLGDNHPATIALRAATPKKYGHGRLIIEPREDALKRANTEALDAGK
jgi:hypothetical protein